MSRMLLIRPEAQSEVVNAFDWYQRCVPGLGQEFLSEIDHVMNGIAQNPLQFPRVFKSVRRALVRRFPYQVLFVSDEERVVVIAVFHAHRDPVRWQDRSSSAS